MAAREDYPRLADWPWSGNTAQLMNETDRALDEIDRLRDELNQIRTIVPPDFFDMLDDPSA